MTPGMTYGMAGEPKRVVLAILHAVGRRNVAYLAFTAAMGPLASLLDSAGSRGLNGDAGGLAAIMLWGIVSGPFVLVNAVLLVRDLVTPREGWRPAQALLACVLPLLVVIAVTS